MVKSSQGKRFDNTIIKILIYILHSYSANLEAQYSVYNKELIYSKYMLLNI